MTHPMIAALAGELAHEGATTRRLLERVPEERFGWRPHPRSMSLGQLSTHLVRLLELWGPRTLEEDGYDLAAGGTAPPPPETRDELLAAFDQALAAFRTALEATDPERLAAPWRLRQGDRVLMELPRAGVVRGLILNHSVHHRGQLSVYLRLLDVPLPPIYGPTADEPAFG